MLIPAAVIEVLCRRVFADTMGAPDHTAKLSTSVLIDADLRGIDSHGFRGLPYYLERWRCGQIVADAEPTVQSESGTTAHMDAQRALGLYASIRATDLALDKARRSGMAATVLNNSTHDGAISFYAMRAAQAGMIGITATACAPHVAAHGGRTGLHGTNPIAYALPRAAGDPVVFDFATGYSAAKLKETASKSGALPADTVIDAQGNATTNPEDLPGGWILPVGGHLGYGLALLLDALACGLGGAPIGSQMPHVTDLSGPYSGSFFVLVISPDSFAGRESFSRQIDELVGQIEKTPPRDEDHPVRWPGQRGKRERESRLRDGIPIADEQWRRLLDQLEQAGVDPTALEM